MVRVRLQEPGRGAGGQVPSLLLVERNERVVLSERIALRGRRTSGPRERDRKQRCRQNHSAASRRAGGETGSETDRMRVGRHRTTSGDAMRSEAGNRAAELCRGRSSVYGERPSVRGERRLRDRFAENRERPNAAWAGRVNQTSRPRRNADSRNGRSAHFGRTFGRPDRVEPAGFPRDPQGQCAASPGTVETTGRSGRLRALGCGVVRLCGIGAFDAATIVRCGLTEAVG